MKRNPADKTILDKIANWSNDKVYAEAQKIALPSLCCQGEKSRIWNLGKSYATSIEKRTVHTG